MIGQAQSLFDAPELDLSELDLPEKKPGRKWLETKEQYKERTGLEYTNPPRKPSQMNITPVAEDKPKKAKNSYGTRQAEEQTLVQLDPMQIRAYGKRMLTFLQSKEMVVKFLTTELGIDSIEAEHEVDMMLGEIRADFQQYITRSTEENIMTLREMEKLALERHDTRSATDIIRTLDQLTTRYLEDNDLLPIKKKKEDEIEIIFS